MTTELPTYNREHCGPIPGPWRSIDHIRAANHNLGHHWFDADTLAWFNGRVLSEVYGRRLFISSERSKWQGVWEGERRYTIRAACDDGSIGTVGKFGGYASADEAKRAARMIMERETRGQATDT